MPIEHEAVYSHGTAKDDRRPTVIEWKRTKMLRIHSITPAVSEILNVARALDVVKIGIIGEPATGKGTLAETLAHLIHKASLEQGYLHWVFRRFGSTEFLDIEATIQSLPPANYILHFQDLSFLAEKKKIDVVKRVTTMIRHLREDVHIILIYDYHYSRGLDKYLRQANFRFFTSVGSSEIDNLVEICGRGYRTRILDFAKKFVEESTKRRCTFKLGTKGFFTYSYKSPFVLSLYWNNHSLRYVVFPLRAWIDPHCTVCAEGTQSAVQSTLDAEKLVAVGKKKFGKSFLTAWKIEDAMVGVNTFGQRAVDAQHWLKKVLANYTVNREEVRVRLELEPHKASKTGKLSLKELSD